MMIYEYIKLSKFFLCLDLYIISSRDATQTYIFGGSSGI